MEFKHQLHVSFLEFPQSQYWAKHLDPQSFSSPESYRQYYAWRHSPVNDSVISELFDSIYSNTYTASTLRSIQEIKKYSEQELVHFTELLRDIISNEENPLVASILYATLFEASLKISSLRFLEPTFLKHKVILSTAINIARYNLKHFSKELCLDLYNYGLNVEFDVFLEMIESYIDDTGRNQIVFHPNLSLALIRNAGFEEPSEIFRILKEHPDALASHTSFEILKNMVTRLYKIANVKRDQAALHDAFTFIFPRDERTRVSTTVELQLSACEERQKKINAELKELQQLYEKEKSESQRQIAKLQEQLEASVPQRGKVVDDTEQRFPLPSQIASLYNSAVTGFRDVLSDIPKPTAEVKRMCVDLISVIEDLSKEAVEKCCQDLFLALAEPAFFQTETNMKIATLNIMRKYYSVNLAKKYTPKMKLQTIIPSLLSRFSVGQEMETDIVDFFTERFDVFFIISMTNIINSYTSTKFYFSYRDKDNVEILDLDYTQELKKSLLSEQKVKPGEKVVLLWPRLYTRLPSGDIDLVHPGIVSVLVQ